MTSSGTTLCLYASEVAALLGENPHADAETAFQRMLQRHHWEVIVPDAIADRVLETHADRVAEVMKTGDLAKAIVDVGDAEKRSVAAVISREVQKVKRDAVVKHDAIVAQATSSSMPMKAIIAQAEIAGVVMNAVEKRAITEVSHQKRGDRDEPAAITEYESAKRTRIESRNDRWYSARFRTPSGKSFVLGGRIDGWDGTTQQLVEVKCRQYRLFKTIPAYERIQTQIYMHLLDTRSCLLLQRSPSGDTREDTLPDDPDLWSRIRTGLNEVVDRAYAFQPKASTALPASTPATPAQSPRPAAAAQGGPSRSSSSLKRARPDEEERECFE